MSSRIASVERPVLVDPKMRPGHISIPNGFGGEYPDENGELKRSGVSINVLTDTQDRDPFTGCPHFKQVRCQVEKVAG